MMICYGESFHELAQKTGLNQTQLDILLFLGNNPDRSTASEIEEIRRIKANLLSVNVDKLVRDGFLTREKDPEDRRKINLHLTEKSRPIAEEAMRTQENFVLMAIEGMDSETRQALIRSLEIVEKNLEKMRGKCR